MFSISDVQADIVAKLKASAVVTAFVPAVEVREARWKGTSFVYPNIRVKMGRMTPVNNLQCTIVKITFDVLCFSENPSSKEADQIAHAVDLALDSNAFTGTYVKFVYLGIIDLIAAESEDDKTWKSTVKFEALLQKVQ